MQHPIKTGKLSDLIPDPSNANKGTERGQYMITESIEQCGLGRSVVTDKSGVLIAGNKTFAIAGQVGLEDTIIVRTTGNQLVVVQRDDLDLSADTSSEAYQRARQLAIADNRAGEVSLSWDAEVLQEYIGEGVELDNWFLPDELGDIFDGIEREPVEEIEPMSDRAKPETECVCPSCGHEFVRLG